MLIDLHAHTKGVSHCCRIEAEDNIILAREVGFDGLAITNHYVSTYYDNSTYDEWIEKYIAEWELCRRLGEKHGLRIFCGVEVTMDYDPRLHMLIYGTDAEFLRKYPHLGSRPLSELHGICREAGCPLIQAHPYRGGTTVQDVRYLDGVEVNCHPLYKNSFREDVIAVAKQNGLALTSGCDYHKDTYRATGGSLLPDSIVTDRDLADYILTSRRFSLRVHEPLDGEIYNVEYER